MMRLYRRTVIRKFAVMNRALRLLMRPAMLHILIICLLKLQKKYLAALSSNRMVAGCVACYFSRKSIRSFLNGGVLELDPFLILSRRGRRFEGVEGEKYK